MLRQLLAISAILSLSFYNAQVGVSTGNPQSTFQVKEIRNSANVSDTSAKDGVLVPKLTKAELSAKSAGTYATEQNGALVYITDFTAGSGPSSSQTSEISTLGFHLLDASDAANIKWRALTNLYNANGTLTGDRTVNQNGKIIAFNGGTTTNAFSVNNGTISVDAVSNNLGVNTTTPRTQLDVNGIVSVKPQIVTINNPVTSVTSPYVIDVTSNIILFKGTLTNNVYIELSPGVEGQRVSLTADGDPNSGFFIAVANTLDNRYFGIPFNQMSDYVFIGGGWRVLWF